MSDKLDKILNRLLVFRKERDWEQFHKPKDLAISIAIESAELLEEFQWKSDEMIKNYVSSSAGLDNIKEEIADIAIYLLLLSHDLQIDLVAAIEDKINKNEKKYPIEKSKGNAEKYDRL